MSSEQVKVVSLEGEIDLHVSPRMAAKFAIALKETPKLIVADLSGVSYIDSSGLAVLIQTMQSAQKYGGEFAIAGLRENVRPIFEIARLDQVFRIFPDVASASAT